MTHHESVRETPCPIIPAVELRTDDTDTDLHGQYLGMIISLSMTVTHQLTPAPARVDKSRQITSQRNRAHFGSIRNGDSLEDTPWYTTQNLTSKERLDVVCSEEQGGGCCEPQKTDDEDVSVSDPLDDETANCDMSVLARRYE